MVKYTHLNRDPGKAMEDLVKKLSASAKGQKTKPTGVKDMGDAGDVVWSKPDGDGVVEKSMRELDDTMDQTLVIIDQAAQDIADLNDVTIPAVRNDLDELNNVTLPGMRDDTQQVATDAAQAVADAEARSDAARDALATQIDATIDAARTDLEGSISEAQQVANGAQSVADQAASDAAAAAQQAADAAGVAASKGDVLIQSTAPVVAMRKATTLWIDTTGGANTPKRWDGTAWVVVTDKAATDAAAAAATAKSTADAAQAKADTAQTTATNAATAAAAADTKAGNAQTTATQALTSANGKNTISRSLSNPPTSYTGRVDDLWWVLSSLGSGGRVLSQWRWNGTVWVSEQIDSAVLAYVDTGKLTAGTATINSAVIDKLWADGVQAKSVATQSITVSPGNLLPDPNGNTAIGRNAYGNLGFAWSDADKAWVRATPGPTNQTKPNAGGDYTSYPLEGGRTYRLYFEAKVEGTTGDGRYAIYYTNRDGATFFVGDGIEGAGGDTAGYTPIPANTWTPVDRTWVAPADAVMGGFALQVNNVNTAQAQRVLIRNPFAGVKTTGTLIENGAVTTDKVAANAITAGKIAAGSIEADKIAANAVSADKIVANAVTGDKIAANSVSADKLTANSVTADKIVASTDLSAKVGNFLEINADQITGGHFTGETFEGGTFVGGEFRTSDTLPGQVVLADDAVDNDFNGGTLGPGIRVTPTDTSDMVYPASIGPSTQGLTIYGGRRTTGGRSIVQCNPDGSFLRTFKEDGERGGTIQTSPTASFMRTFHGGGGTAGEIQTSPNSSYMRTYREDGGTAGEILTSPSWSYMRTYREDGSEAGSIQTSPTDSRMTTRSGNGSERGWVRVQPQDVELAYVDPNNTYFSHIRADASEAFLFTRAGGANRYLSVDANGVWVKTNKSGTTKSYNLEETAQDSGWQSFPVRSGITATSVAYRNKGGVAFFRGSINSTWAVGWNTVVTGLSAVQPSFEMRAVVPVGSTANYLIRMLDTGTMEVYAPSAGTQPINLSSLSYPIG